MADPESQTPHIEAGGPALPTGDSSRETSGGQDNQEQVQGAGETTVPGHWCYQCNKEVIAEAEADGVPDAMVCSECRSGFIEAMATAQTVPDVRRAQRRRRRRATATAAIIAGASPGATARQMVPLSEALEHLYPQHLMQVLQLLGQAANRSNTAPPASQDEETNTILQAQELGEVQTPTSGEEGETANLSGFLSSLNTSREEASGGLEGRRETSPEGEESGAIPTLAATGGALDRITPGGHLMLVPGTSPSQDDDDGDEELVVSDTETEEGMRLEFDTWDSADEDDDEEWEEVDEDEEAPETGAEDGVGEDNETELQEGDLPQEQNGEERQPRVREIRLRTRNMEHNLHQYLQEVLQNLVGQNIEVRVELPDGPLYVGNPGDYVDARGFEMLLQQMAENDNSRRGAPPASKAAVERLPSISIEQSHVDDGSAVCAICKDVVAVGEPAKQLPCLHLYHEDCILPWLNSRNSCPVCRYELPTDDSDYEEQKQSRNGAVRSSSTSQSPSSLTQVAEDGPQSNSNAGGDQVSDASSHQSNVRENIVDAVEPTGTSNSRNQGEQVAPGGGDQGHMESATELSFSQGLDTTNANNPHSRDQGGERESRENESDEVDRGETMRGTGRGWFLLAAGPVLSMMGLVLVLCIGNHLIGGRMQHLGRPLQRQQHFFQEPHIEQIGGGSEVQGRRRWWMPFQR